MLKLRFGTVEHVDLAMSIGENFSKIYYKLCTVSFTFVHRKAAQTSGMCSTHQVRAPHTHQVPCTCVAHCARAPHAPSTCKIHTHTSVMCPTHHSIRYVDGHTLTKAHPLLEVDAYCACFQDNSWQLVHSQVQQYRKLLTDPEFRSILFALAM